MLKSLLAALMGSTTLMAAAAAPPGHVEMLRRLIHEAVEDHLRYDTMTPELADVVRPQAAAARAELVALGALRSLTFTRVNADGQEIYRAEFEKGALDWAFAVDAQGRISNAAFRPAGS